MNLYLGGVYYYNTHLKNAVELVDQCNLSNPSDML